MFVKETIRIAFMFIAIAALAGFFQPGFVSAAKRSLPQVDASLYSETPIPLQPAECGQCHEGQFANLKDSGGKHRFACQECHETFHAYNPRKNNYDELMPVCTICHSQPHGPKQVDCLNCHQNPHTPLLVPAVDRLSKSCADCHEGPAKELKQFPSAHTEQGCQSCHHEKHGYIPNCSECHDGHYSGQSDQDCLSCHARVHAPLKINFPADAGAQSCSSCHDDVYAKWQGTPSKHGEVACVMCHQKHGQVPDCRECHAEPHNKKQLEMFPNCLTCHIDVHDLPVK
jgi:hypothetical protein